MIDKSRPLFACRNLRVAIEDKQIVKGADLEIYAGQKHALMGPNGSGKSTLAAALMGHPAYHVEGEILLEGKPIHELPAHERARLGMFLGFQYPVAVPGVSVANFLRAALSARRGEAVPIKEFRRELFARQCRQHNLPLILHYGRLLPVYQHRRLQLRQQHHCDRKTTSTDRIPGLPSSSTATEPASPFSTSIST